MPKRRFVVIGKAVRPFGIRGEIKVNSYCESTVPFTQARELIFGDTPYVVKSVRFHKEAVLVAVEGIETPEAARDLVGKLVKADSEVFPPKEEGEYYWYELLGIRVVTVNGQELGRITGIIPTKANDVLQVTGPEGEMLLPMIEDVVLQIDLEAHLMLVDPLDGLVPDA